MKPHPAGFPNSAEEGQNFQSAVCRIHSKSVGPTSAMFIELELHVFHIIRLNIQSFLDNLKNGNFV